ncbi:hypothetical protein JTE90_001916 [Oedothorax gibbosus]|uniref:Uncharacterized protein n=1 Tax=Oedothorax gibbosus TaxID=931172 RepID=A0AAV6VWF3_9ARAC|nr:hypothetical protein JTE90_001916 [Oedothorax gibbosus]
MLIPSPCLINSIHTLTNTTNSTCNTTVPFRSTFVRHRSTSVAKCSTRHCGAHNRSSCSKFRCRFLFCIVAGFDSVRREDIILCSVGNFFKQLILAIYFIMKILKMENDTHQIFLPLNSEPITGSTNPDPEHETIDETYDDRNSDPQQMEIHIIQLQTSQEFVKIRLLPLVIILEVFHTMMVTGVVSSGILCLRYFGAVKGFAEIATTSLSYTIMIFTMVYFGPGRQAFRKLDYLCWNSTMIAKILLIVVLTEIASANHLYGIIGEAYHAPQPYKFGYQVKDKEGAQHRHEESDGHGNVRGSYGYTDDKGQYREVHYVADKNGFRAQVKTNEAGTANQNPAHVDVKADPPQHHFPQHHHVPHHDHDVKFHHDIPHHHEVKVHHHVPEIKFHHDEVTIPHNHDVKFHHQPEIKFHHQPEIKFHQQPEIKFHNVPHYHEEVKINHHVPQFNHQELKVEPIHGFKKEPSFSSLLGGHGLNNFSPLHGFSYNPSAYHGYGQWPFQESNIYGKQHSSWKDHKGFGDHKFQGFSGLSNFDGNIAGLSSSNKDKYAEIMEKIRTYRKDGALTLLSDLQDNTGSKFKNWKFGNGNFDF